MKTYLNNFEALSKFVCIKIVGACDGARFSFSPCCPKLIWLNSPLSAWRYFSVYLSTTKITWNLDEQPAGNLKRTDSIPSHTKSSIHLYTPPSRNYVVSQLLPNQIIQKSYFMIDLKPPPGSRSPCPLPWGCAVAVFFTMSWVLPSSKTWGFSSLRCWRWCSSPLRALLVFRDWSGTSEPISPLTLESGKRLAPKPGKGWLQSQGRS